MSAALLVAGGAGLAAEASPGFQEVTAAQAQVYVGLTPERVLDTRVPIGVATKRPMNPGETMTLKLRGLAGIPESASSVVINVTIDRDATERSYITIWPTGEDRPNTSANNASPGLVKANNFTAKLGPDGAVNIFNFRGHTNLVLDVVGFYVPLSTVPTSASAPAADAGPTMLVGAGAPAAQLGDDGDAYMDTAALVVYGPKDSGAWGTGRPLDDDDDVMPGMLVGSGAPAPGLGEVGNSYLDNTGLLLYGPKTAAGWGTDPVDLQASTELKVGSGAPAAALGDEGDTYLDRDALQLYGPKTAAGWGSDPLSLGGADLLVGSGAPAEEVGEDGDSYLDSDSLDLYGPKSAAGWGAPLGLGSTDLLVGAGAPAGDLGGDGDTYFDEAGLALYGPKTGAGWGEPISLGGTDLLVGAGAPAAGLGDVGDTYVDETAAKLYGPKTGTGWGDPIDLGGTDLLFGSGAPAPGLGEVGDSYFDSDTMNLYGPKTGSGWGSATSLAAAPSEKTDSVLSAYNDSGLAGVVINSGAAVPFNTAGISLGMAVTQLDEETFVLEKAGVYRVSYNLNTAAASALGGVRVEIDGVATGPTWTLASAGLPLHGEVLVEGGPSETLQLVGTGLNLSLSSGSNASIIIELVAVIDDMPMS